MSKEETKTLVGDGSGLVILQKTHLVFLLIIIVGVAFGSYLYSGDRLNRVENDVKELKIKVDELHAMRGDIKTIMTMLADIKEWQHAQDQNIKEFYKLYKLEPK